MNHSEHFSNSAGRIDRIWPCRFFSLLSAMMNATTVRFSLPKSNSYLTDQILHSCSITGFDNALSHRHDFIRQDQASKHISPEVNSVDLGGVLYCYSGCAEEGRQ